MDRNDVNSGLGPGPESETGSADSEVPLGTASTKKSPRRLRGWFILIAIVVLCGIAAAVSVGLLAENKHYLSGVKHLEAKNYDEAEAELRLCLEEKPEHRRAKGLLAYSVLRVFLDDVEDTKPEELRDRCLSEFLRYYSHLMMDDLPAKVGQKDTRTWIKKRIDIAEDDVRDVLKERKVPFRDWVEFKLGLWETAKELFRLRVDSDDPLDQLAKDLAAALLAQTGDRKAQEYLMDRCANDDELLSLTLVAGPQMGDLLSKEAKHEGSFIAEESKVVLRFLKLVPEIVAFANDHPKLRSMRESDLPSKQEKLYESHLDFTKKWYYGLDESNAYLAFGGIPQQLLFQNAVSAAEFDPTAVSLLTRELEEGESITVLGGFDDAVEKNVYRAMAWDGSEWVRLEFSKTAGAASENEWQDRLPLGDALIYDKNKKRLAVPFRACKVVRRERTEQRQRDVVRYRKEYKYVPNLRYDTYYQTWRGGYDWVDVPFSETESYLVPVGFDENAVGNEWRLFKLDVSRGRLWMEDSEWAEFGMPFEGLQD